MSITLAIHAGLTAANISQFHREGFLVVDHIFTDEDIQAFADDITDLIDVRAQTLLNKGELSDLYTKEPFESRLAKITAEDESIYWAINGGQLATQGIFNLLTTPALLDVTESLVGPEIIASSVYRLRPKLPGHWHGIVPWHQDSGYFEPYCDTSLILTVWIPLVDATVERGCLEVLPQAHLGNVLTHHPAGDDENEYKGYLRINEADLPTKASKPIPVPVQRVSALLLSNRTPHRSTENTSDIVRWSMDFRFQSADLPTNYRAPSGWINTALPSEAPAACYPPEADFLVRSRLRPQDVVRERTVFQKIRDSHGELGMTDRWGAGHSVASYHRT